PAPLTEMCRVAQQEVVPGAVISGPTAAVHFGIRMPHRYDGGVSLLCAGATDGPHGRVIPSAISSDRVTDPFAGADGLTAAFPTVHCLRSSADEPPPLGHRAANGGQRAAGTGHRAG